LRYAGDPKDIHTRAPECQALGIADGPGRNRRISFEVVSMNSSGPPPMNLSIDTPHFRRFGWIRIRRAVPAKLCGRLVEILEDELGVPVHDPSGWDAHGGEMRDLVPVRGH
jgi:hypothetical protein